MRSRTLLASLLLPLSVPAAVAGQTREPLVQSVDVVIPVPPTPVTIAGARHLAYELHVTNFTIEDVALSRVEVFDAGRGTRLAGFADSALAGRIGRPGLGTAPADSRVIGGGRRAVVFLWLALDDSAPTPSSLRHRIEYAAVLPSGRRHGTVETDTTAVRDVSPLVLGAPVRGGPWVALYDPAMQRGHRRSIYTVDGRARIPGRFAIDWIRLDDGGTHARGDASLIANWHGFGAEVLAVADGIVVEAMDDIAEDSALASAARPVALENASGNHVTLDLGMGRHALYEHLKQGSLRVRTGDRVKRGDVIGSLGNSGSSSAGPHLHFHVADANATIAAEGLPYVFTEFRVLGAFESIGKSLTGERWLAAPGGTGGTRRLELPAANTVVTFPDAP